jgi:sugar/nucleoside kinase (ribokinase family)
MKSLYQTASFEAGLDALRKDCRLGIVTRSEKGSVVVRAQETVEVPPLEISELVDTTGAGDLYAAGFLHGYTKGRPLADCGALGSLAAGLVIQQVGPRPRQNLPTRPGSTGWAEPTRYPPAGGQAGSCSAAAASRNAARPP